MENPDQGVIDFLTNQLTRREDERIRLDDQLVRTYSRNLATLVSTWRFIVVTRVVSFALGLGALQFILLNVAFFLDASKLLPILENFFGRDSGIVGQVKVWSSVHAAYLVAIIISMIVFVIISFDILLARLQMRCRERGWETEQYLRINGLFTEIRVLRGLIGLPFWLGRTILLVFVIVVLAQLGNVLRTGG